MTVKWGLGSLFCCGIFLNGRFNTQGEMVKDDHFRNRGTGRPSIPAHSLPSPPLFHLEKPQQNTAPKPPFHRRPLRSPYADSLTTHSPLPKHMIPDNKTVMGTHTFKVRCGSYIGSSVYSFLRRLHTAFRHISSIDLCHLAV